MMSLSERLYQLLLKTYPMSYHREYEGPMLQHFRDQLRSASSAKELFRFWLRIITDLAGTVPARHLERWLPHHRHHSPFTEDARQAIFFARYEASSFARSEITLEHLLLGVLRNDQALQSRLGQRGIEDVVRQIEAAEAVSRRIPPEETLPLSQQAKHAARQAVDAASASGEPRATTGHLIRAILQQETSLAARILRECGIDGSTERPL
jgi:hypothetical protein